MDFIADPFAIFKKSCTPFGLYARKRWLGEDSQAWKRDFDATVSESLAGQRPDGSWYGSVAETVRRLFNLHLTVRHIRPEIDRGLDWLCSVCADLAQTQRSRKNNDDTKNVDLKGLPFLKGDPFLLALSAWLFLSCVFGRAEDKYVLLGYSLLERMGAEDIGAWGGKASFCNIFRAFVVHPLFSKKKAVCGAVRRLAEVQKPDGTWPKPIHLYSTLNALCHLDGQGEAPLVRKAFSYVLAHMNRDGSWGAVEREWNTFLVVHALKRKGLA